MMMMKRSSDLTCCWPQHPFGWHSGTQYQVQRPQSINKCTRFSLHFPSYTYVPKQVTTAIVYSVIVMLLSGRVSTLRPISLHRLKILHVLQIPISTSLTQFSRQCFADKKQINTSYVLHSLYLHSQHLCGLVRSFALLLPPTTTYYSHYLCQCMSVVPPSASSLIDPWDGMLSATTGIGAAQNKDNQEV